MYALLNLYTVLLRVLLTIQAFDKNHFYNRGKSIWQYRVLYIHTQVAKLAFRGAILSYHWMASTEIVLTNCHTRAAAIRSSWPVVRYTPYPSVDSRYRSRKLP